MSERDLKEKYVPRLLDLYRGTLIMKIKETFSLSNIFEVPRLKKIVINMGVGEGINDSKLVEKAAGDLAVITGQKAKITRAKKPISNFKIRKGMPIGCCVTLRANRMYEFLDRLVSVALPRIKDFRGFSADSFDGKGNYTFGLTEQTIFPELDLDKVERTQGMNITFCISGDDDKKSLELMKLFGFPFKR